ncbi:hypothetical protein FQN54_007780 [Arachnomyces sp. PD_36]|nr:hypothetical protein FQN54_007780 [Arachnomyces sp. PD_36]
MPGCPFENIPLDVFLCVLDFVPVRDYFSLKLAGSRRINEGVRFATSRFSRGEYSQRICKEYRRETGKTASAVRIQIERDQGALVQHFVRKYQNEKNRKIRESNDYKQTERRAFRSSLLWAAYYGSVSVAKLLLDYIEVRTPVTGDAPLHVAAGSGHLKVVELLATNGARIDVLNFDGRTPLQLALENNHDDIAVFLRSKGASSNLEEVCQVYKNDWEDLFGGSLSDRSNLAPFKSCAKSWEWERTNHRRPSFRATIPVRDPSLKQFAMHRFYEDTGVTDHDGWRLKSLVEDLITYNHPDLLSSILDEGFSPHSVLNRKGDTALLHAVRMSRTSIIQVLLERETDGTPPLHCARNTGQCTPLHLASKPEILLLLLERGADVNAGGPNGRTVLHTVSEAEIAQLLLENGADVNIGDSDGYTPLHLASEPGIVQLLLEHGADPNAKDLQGRTPAHYLISECISEESLCHNEEILDLLQKRGADFNTKDENGETPLKAALKSQNRLVRKLLTFGVDVHNTKTSESSTPQDESDEHNQHSLVQRILDRKSDIEDPYDSGTRYSNRDTYPDHPNIPGAFDQPPTCTAVQYASLDAFEALVDYGADILWKDSHGLNLLHYALKRSFGEAYIMTPSLLKHGVDVNAKDISGNTPLFLAVYHRRSDIACTLLENGALANVSNCRGYTPLHYVVRDYTGPTTQIIKALVAKGADVNARTEDGSMPIHIAARRDRNHHIVKLLLEYGADVNAKDREGRTALHCIVLQKIPYFGHVLSELLRHGARVDEHDQDGLTPLDIAMDKNEDLYVDILLRRSEAKGT